MKKTPSFPKWASRLLVSLLAIGMLIVVADCVLMAGFALQASGITLPYVSSPTATRRVQWTPTATALPTQETPTATATTAVTATPTATATPPTVPTSTPTPVVWPTVTPTPTIIEWRGEYYGNEGLIGFPALVRNDRAIAFEWGAGAPAPDLPADTFSARWTRTTYFSEGIYTFHAVADDGIRLYVDGAVVIDEWRDGSRRERTVERTLSDGQHTLRVEYYERTGAATAHVWWERGGAYPDWKGEYWPNRHLDGTPALVRNDDEIDFNWKQDSPDEAIPSNNFSARWTREADFEAHAYRFHAKIDDGVRVWVDGDRIIDDWEDNSAHEVTADRVLTKGTHQIRVEYYERSGEAQIHVWWEKVDSASYPDWKGRYWSNRNLSGDPDLVRNDERIDFDWGAGAPASGLPQDNFSARWTREVDFEARTYRFHVRVDDGVRVWIDDQQVIDAWYNHDLHEVTADRAMVRGTHKIRVEYYEHKGGAQIEVWWEAITPQYPDWKVRYWSNRNLSGDPDLVRNDRAIDFDWAGHSPATGLPVDGFSARWTDLGTFQPGIYRFYARADDSIRFYVDGELILDEWHGHQNELYSVDMAMNGSYKLKVEYAEHTGDAHVQFWWERVGNLPTPTPTATIEPTPTATATIEPTPTATATIEPTPTATATTEPTPTATATTEPTPTETATTEPTPTETATTEPTPTVTATATETTVP